MSHRNRRLRIAQLNHALAWLGTAFNATPTRIADVNPLAGTDSPTARTVFTEAQVHKGLIGLTVTIIIDIVAALWSHLLDGDAGCLSVDTFGYTLTTPP